MAAFMLQWKDGVDATAAIPQSQKYSLWLLRTGSLPTSALGHCFSNFNVHTGLLGILLKHSFWLSSSWRSLTLCISNKLPVILMMRLMDHDLSVRDPGGTVFRQDVQDYVCEPLQTKQRNVASSISSTHFISAPSSHQSGWQKLSFSICCTFNMSQAHLKQEGNLMHW